MDLRKIVRDRMEELTVNVPSLAALSRVSATTLYDFLRDPKDMRDYDEAYEKTRKGTLNSDALGRVFDALGIEIAYTDKPKRGKK